jgi:hypothetical protein
MSAEIVQLGHQHRVMKPENEKDMEEEGRL